MIKVVMLAGACAATTIGCAFKTPGQQPQGPLVTAIAEAVSRLSDGVARPLYVDSVSFVAGFRRAGLDMTETVLRRDIPRLAGFGPFQAIRICAPASWCLVPDDGIHLELKSLSRIGTRYCAEIVRHHNLSNRSFITTVIEVLLSPSNGAWAVETLRATGDAINPLQTPLCG